MAASNRGLRPATIPTGSAIATANTTATNTCVNVSMVSYQMPEVSVGTWSPATTSVQSATVTTKSLIDWRNVTLSLIHSTASLIGLTMSQCTDVGNEPAPMALATTT